MTPQPEKQNALQQKFNGDLLICKEDQKLAAERYPAVLHVLDHPELRECFTQYDDPANSAKSRSRKVGSVAIAFATLALFCASGEVLFQGDLSALGPLALAGVVFGILSVILSSVGVLYGPAKREWLLRRLMTERLRQFHFQTFLSLLPEIIASLHGSYAKTQFILARRQNFNAFLAKMQGNLEAALTDVLGLGAQEPETWIDRPPPTPPIAEDDSTLTSLFDAYRELRIEHQRSYANFKIRDDNRILSGAPRRQAAVLENFGFACIVLLLSIHLAVGTAILIAWIPRAQLAPALIPVLMTTLNAAIIWIAVAALAGRALAQGLQPEREIERYQQYGSDCKAILERFDAAPSQADKVGIMMEMERLSYDEMRNFLITNQRARFVM